MRITRKYHLQFLLSSKFKNRNIQVIDNLEKINFFGYENEMIQAFMNILNNAKDALEEIKETWNFGVVSDKYKLNYENILIWDFSEVWNIFEIDNFESNTILETSTLDGDSWYLIVDNINKDLYNYIFIFI